MKIIKVDPLIQNFVLDTYRNNLRMYLQQLISNKVLDNVIETYSEDDIMDIPNRLYLDNGYICIRSDSLSGMIFRLLQFGGPGLKATSITFKSGLGLEEI